MLHVWVLNAGQRSVLFGDDAAMMSDSRTGTRGRVGDVQISGGGIEEVVPVTTSSLAREQTAPDSAKSIKRLSAELGTSARGREVRLCGAQSKVGEKGEEGICGHGASSFSIDELI